jgi:hypothetical protein
MHVAKTINMRARRSAPARLVCYTAAASCDGKGTHFFCAREGHECTIELSYSKDSFFLRGIPKTVGNECYLRDYPAYGKLHHRYELDTHHLKYHFCSSKHYISFLLSLHCLSLWYLLYVLVYFQFYFTLCSSS